MSDLRAALADMTRQRDEAVKAFQRERAKVVRVEAIAADYTECDWFMPSKKTLCLLEYPDDRGRWCLPCDIRAALDAP